jgi:hypothetical protein
MPNTDIVRRTNMGRVCPGGVFWQRGKRRSLAVIEVVWSGDLDEIIKKLRKWIVFTCNLIPLSRRLHGGRRVQEPT